jgi:hypothetical protein
MGTTGSEQPNERLHLSPRFAQRRWNAVRYVAVAHTSNPGRRQQQGRDKTSLIASLSKRVTKAIGHRYRGP